jgi:hypothetical protein
MQKKIVFSILFLFLFSSFSLALERPDKEFKIFQFPPNIIPKIDGDPSDWNIVPDDYAITMDELEDDVYNSKIDKKDKDCKIKVGWVKGMNVLYFLYESYDDYWRVSQDDLINDIFEISVDGDLSGELIIGDFHPNMDKIGRNNLHYIMHGVNAQNYHIFTPPGNKDWCMVWGCANWLKRLPYSNSAIKTDFKGNSGKLVLECWITPYNYASPDGPDKSVPAKLEENKIIGLTWGISDYDSILIAGRPYGNNYDGQFNLSHSKSWFISGRDACAFKLMPLEKRFQPAIKAFFTFKIIDMDNKKVAFKDESIGNITKWTWDFGDSTFSNEQNPVHIFKYSGMHPMKLTVEGPAGKSMFPLVYEELLIK